MNARKWVLLLAIVVAMVATTGCSPADLAQWAGTQITLPSGEVVSLNVVAPSATVTVMSTPTQGVTATSVITSTTPTLAPSATVGITSTPTLGVTATAMVTPTATMTPTLAPSATVGITSTPTQGVTPIGTSRFSATVPSGGIIPAKGLLVNDSLLWSHVVRDPGVLGADNLQEADANESAVWTGGANHQIPDQSTVGAIVPEAGYLTAYASGMLVQVGDVALELPNCGSDCGWGLIVRGSNTEPTAVTIENLGAAGGLIYTRYPVPRHAGAFFSERYLSDQAKNFLAFDNCGVDGCSEMLQAVYDINDQSLTVLRYTAAGWEMIWTNVQATP